MFSSGPNYTKLKTNIRLALNRLKLLEKKKAELAQKARKEIADYLATNKIERARIRVEHIIREDYLVEAMEIVEMYCDLLLARFGLVTQMKELDEGISEAVSSLVWVCPRLQSDIPELKVMSDIFIQKYGPQFAEYSRTATGEHNVSEKLMHKLQLQAPPKLLVEKYLIEIAKNYNIEYEPDPQVMKDDNKDDFLIDLGDKSNSGGAGAPPQMGFIGYPLMPPLPPIQQPPANKPFSYPPPFGGNAGGGGAPHPGYNLRSNTPYSAASANDLSTNTNFINEETNSLSASPSSPNGSPDDNNLNAKFLEPPPRYSSINPHNSQDANKPTPQPRLKMPPPSTGLNNPSAPPVNSDIPNLPSVPSDLPDIPGEEHTKPNNDDEIDFEDLSRRFANLKKR